MLGQGQYGTVHLVKHRITHEFLAMKQLNKSQTVKDDAVENTNTERQVHPSRAGFRSRPPP